MSTNTTSDDDEEHSPFNHPTGRRFISGEVLEIERELIAEGVDLPNRGIPSEYERHVKRCSDVDELRGLIETECQKPNPNQSLIGYVNDRLEEVRG